MTKKIKRILCKQGEDALAVFIDRAYMANNMPNPDNLMKRDLEAEYRKKYLSKEDNNDKEV